MPTVVTLGEALVDFVADTAGVTLIECPGFRKAPGGAPANVAVGLARLGVDTAFLGRVGDDPFGHFLEQTLSGAGVDTRFVTFDGEARTGLAFVSLQANGERDFVFYRNPSADMRHRPKDIPDAALEGCRIYHFGSISLIQDPSRAATLDALHRSRRNGSLISFDPNLRPPLWADLEHARREIREALPLSDLVKVSEEEAEFLFGPAPVDTYLDRLLEAGPRLVALTQGSHGCLLATAGSRASVPGYAVQAVDTTGAGDGFVAGLLTGLLESSDPTALTAEALAQIGRFANAIGAITCQQKGAIPALPTRERVQAFLASQSG